MKRLLFVLIIFTVVFYDGYQIKYYFETQKALEKDLRTKSEKISEVIKYFLKEKLEKGYALEELFYNKIFEDFKSGNLQQREYITINDKFETFGGEMNLEINKLQPKLHEIIVQKIKAIELYNSGDYVVLAGYKNNGIIAVKYDIPHELKNSLSVDEFRKSVMEKGDIKEIKVSTEQKMMNANETEKVIEKEITIYDSLNETQKKFIISIKFDMSNYRRMTNKNLTDIIFSIIVTMFIILLTGFYAYINNKYYRTIEYLKDKEKDILVGSIASGVAHEIRNPLNSINYTIEYIKAIAKDEEVGKNLVVIKDEIKRIDRSLKEFLDIRKEISLHMEHISINEIIGELFLILNKEYEEHKILFEIEEKSKLDIEGDRDKIKEVFLNILKNSKESIKHDKGKITVRIDKKEIVFADNGTGMDKEEIEKMFNLYYTTKEDGNGIGMYRVKKIIEGHNGKIIVKSKKGIGTETTVIFDEVR